MSTADWLVCPALPREVSGREARQAFYDRKRAEGKRHNQAVLVLASRVNVIWAMLRDERLYQERPSQRVLAA